MIVFATYYVSREVGYATEMIQLPLPPEKVPKSQNAPARPVRYGTTVRTPDGKRVEAHAVQCPCCQTKFSVVDEGVEQVMPCCIRCGQAFQW